jgi:beta-glucosidase
MPYTVVPSVEQLPPYDDMDITAGRSYRYYGTTNQTRAVAPLWLFGDGLSYTSWNYSAMNLSIAAVGQCANVTVGVTVTNTGKVAGSEVAQLYVTIPNTQLAGTPTASPGSESQHPNKAMRTVRPLWQLAGVVRTATLAPGASARLVFTINARALSVVYADGRRYVEHGEAILWAGGSSPAGLMKEGMQKATVKITGPYPLELSKCPAAARNIV